MGVVELRAVDVDVAQADSRRGGGAGGARGGAGGAEGLGDGVDEVEEGAAGGDAAVVGGGHGDKRAHLPGRVTFSMCCCSIR